MLSLLAARSSPAVNVAEIDRERILKAAEMALAQPTGNHHIVAGKMEPGRSQRFLFQRESESERVSPRKVTE